MTPEEGRSLDPELGRVLNAMYERLLACFGEPRDWRVSR